MEKCEDIRHTIGMKEVYAQRKETVERLFGTAKENHGFRYTQMIGKARMEMKVGLTFACMNLKKLAKMIARKGKRGAQKCDIVNIGLHFFLKDVRPMLPPVMNRSIVDA